MNTIFAGNRLKETEAAYGATQPPETRQQGMEVREEKGRPGRLIPTPTHQDKSSVIPLDGAAMTPAPSIIVRYAGCAVKFHRNLCGNVYELVADEEATVFATEALAHQAIGRYHIAGRAYPDRL